MDSCGYVDQLAGLISLLLKDRRDAHDLFLKAEEMGDDEVAARAGETMAICSRHISYARRAMRGEL